MSSQKDCSVCKTEPMLCSAIHDEMMPQPNQYEEDELRSVLHGDIQTALGFADIREWGPEGQKNYEDMLDTVMERVKQHCDRRELKGRIDEVKYKMAEYSFIPDEHRGQMNRNARLKNLQDEDKEASFHQAFDFVSFAEELGYKNPMYLPQETKTLIEKARQLITQKQLEELQTLPRKTKRITDGLGVTLAEVDFIDPIYVANRIAELTKQEEKC